MTRPTESKPPGLREIWAWCMYDFANSSFTTLIVTVAYSVYFVQVVARDAGHEGSAERLWLWGYSASMLVAAVLAPTLGALADVRACKRLFLIASTLICVVFTALLALVQPGDIWIGLLFFGIANIAFDLGFQFCSAFLPEISTSENIGRISGYGWGLGYMGGLVSLAIAYPFIRGGFTEANLSFYQMSFAVTAAFFLVTALPTFFFLRERAVPAIGLKTTSAWIETLKRLGETARQVPRYRDLFVYLIGYLIYTDAINTVIVASAIFANKVLDFSPGDLIIYFLITQITAGLGAVGFGVLADRIGAKQTIGVTLVLWVLIAVAASVVQTHGQFYVIGLAAGAALGANQSASRTLLARFTPMGREGQFFGFFTVTGKVAAIFGPIVYGEVTARTGSQRWAVLAMAIFFAVGLVAIQFVNEKRGSETAKL